MWRAAAVFLVILPTAGLVAWWIFYRNWRRTPVGLARREAAERAERERLEIASRRRPSPPPDNGSEP
jgi:hypothetical protein